MWPTVHPLQEILIHMLYLLLVYLSCCWIFVCCGGSRKWLETIKSTPMIISSFRPVLYLVVACMGLCLLTVLLL
jgi:hypothetical protein